MARHGRVFNSWIIVTLNTLACPFFLLVSADRDVDANRWWPEAALLEVNESKPRPRPHPTNRARPSSGSGNEASKLGGRFASQFEKKDEKSQDKDADAENEKTIDEFKETFGEAELGTVTEEEADAKKALEEEEAIAAKMEGGNNSQGQAQSQMDFDSFQIEPLGTTNSTANKSALAKNVESVVKQTEQAEMGEEGTLDADNKEVLKEVEKESSAKNQSGVEQEPKVVATSTGPLANDIKAVLEDTEDAAKSSQQDVTDVSSTKKNTSTPNNNKTSDLKEVLDNINAPIEDATDLERQEGTDKAELGTVIKEDADTEAKRTVDALEQSFGEDSMSAGSQAGRDELGKTKSITPAVEKDTSAEMGKSKSDMGDAKPQEGDSSTSSQPSGGDVLKVDRDTLVTDNNVDLSANSGDDSDGFKDEPFMVKNDKLLRTDGSSISSQDKALDAVKSDQAERETFTSGPAADLAKELMKDDLAEGKSITAMQNPEETSQGKEDAAPSQTNTEAITQQDAKPDMKKLGIAPEILTADKMPKPAPKNEAGSDQSDFKENDEVKSILGNVTSEQDMQEVLQMATAPTDGSLNPPEKEDQNVLEPQDGPKAGSELLNALEEGKTKKAEDQAQSGEDKDAQAADLQKALGQPVQDNSDQTGDKKRSKGSTGKLSEDSKGSQVSAPPKQLPKGQANPSNLGNESKVAAELAANMVWTRNQAEAKVAAEAAESTDGGGKLDKEESTNQAGDITGDGGKLDKEENVQLKVESPIEASAQDVAAMQAAQLTVEQARDTLAEAIKTLEMQKNYARFKQSLSTAIAEHKSIQEAVMPVVNDIVGAVLLNSGLKKADFLAFAAMLVQDDKYLDDEEIRVGLTKIKEVLVGDLSPFEEDQKKQLKEMFTGGAVKLLKPGHAQVSLPQPRPAVWQKEGGRQLCDVFRRHMQELAQDSPIYVETSTKPPSWWIIIGCPVVSENSEIRGNLLITVAASSDSAVLYSPRYEFPTFQRNEADDSFTIELGPPLDQKVIYDQLGIQGQYLKTPPELRDSNCKLVARYYDIPQPKGSNATTWELRKDVRPVLQCCPGPDQCEEPLTKRFM